MFLLFEYENIDDVTMVNLASKYRLHLDEFCKYIDFYIRSDDSEIECSIRYLPVNDEVYVIPNLSYVIPYSTKKWIKNRYGDVPPEISGLSRPKYTIQNVCNGNVKNEYIHKLMLGIQINTIRQNIDNEIPNTYMKILVNKRYIHLNKCKDALIKYISCELNNKNCTCYHNQLGRYVMYLHEKNILPISIEYELDGKIHTLSIEKIYVIIKDELIRRGEASRIYSKNMTLKPCSEHRKNKHL